MDFFRLCVLYCAVFCAMETSSPLFAGHSVSLQGLQKKVLRTAVRLMDEAEISYIFGGQLPKGGAQGCRACVSCLRTRTPLPDHRLRSCPECRSCGLDCSHFTSLALQGAGLQAPYLTTRQMLELSADELFYRFNLLPVPELSRARAGDLLVYRGHVVLLEGLVQIAGAPFQSGHPLRGHIIHATSGRTVRAPGQGIQRETNVDLENFRGKLKRILRHKKLFTREDLISP